MAYCQKCGATLDPNSQFCPSCGAAIASTGPQAPPQAWSPPAQGVATGSTMQRPTGVTVLAILAIIGAAFSFIFAIAVGLISAIISGISSTPGGTGGMFAGIATGIAAFFIIIGVVELATAFGLWTGKGWAWWLAIIVAVLDIISIVELNVIGLIIGIVMLYYLTRPHVKVWFHRN